MSRLSLRVIVFSLVAVLSWADTAGISAEEGDSGSAGMLPLQLRTRVESAPSSGHWHAVTRRVMWPARETALVICDMWNDHYCVAAAQRVAEMAPHMNRLIAEARRRGALIIHSPSGCMDKYEGWPQRRRAQQAPPFATSIPLQSWCFRNPLHEPPLPVSDEHPCEDVNLRPAVRFFERQIETLEIAPEDAITDSAEAFYLIKQRGIRHVLVMGVHMNMCVLGRPFGIRQLVQHGLDVALVRDMSDTMYNPDQPPGVSHFTGNDLVSEHIERYWCPTVTSADVLGGKPFRFSDDRRPHLVVVMAEDEYETADTLPRFVLDQHLGRDFRVSYVHASWTDPHDLPGWEVLREADIALWSLRRRALPAVQLQAFRDYVASGKPLVAIRTTSHGFCLRPGQSQTGGEQWPTFDREVLGGYYQNHYGNELVAIVRIASGGSKHPVLSGVGDEPWSVRSSLYRSSPLAPTATSLLMGEVPGHAAEPVAWTNTTSQGGKVFYTSLGHPTDFELPAFQRLLRNALYWGAGLAARL
ncbi:MAG: ThuA domain-containing protein [Pirellulaceae bacterium]